MLPLLHTGQIRRQSAVQPSAGCRRLRAVCLSKRRSPQPVSWRVHAASAEVAEESAVPTPSEERGAEETSTSYDDSDLVFEIPDWIKKRNAEFAEEISGKLILAPLTKGGNMPFRRLCMSFGAEVTMSEMAFTKPLIKGDKAERARLYRAPDENCYGFQVATKTITDGVLASKMAKEAGARWMDINCGCPIYEAMSKGMGAAMLRKPRSLAKMVAGIVAESELPITVKIRIGENDKKINVDRVVRLLSAAGAAAITVHGRTMEQRYKKPADWSIINSVVSPDTAPIIGNGDICTHYEATDRASAYGTHALMAGRGALIRPWLFGEFKSGQAWHPDARERVGVYRKLVSYMKEHFGDDAMGRRKAWYFFPWHFSFFHRYRALPEDVYGQLSREHPLILTRMDIADPRVNEELGSLPLLERLLRAESELAHGWIADALWDAESDADAISRMENVGLEQMLAWEEDVRSTGGRDGSRGGGLGVGAAGGGDDRDREGGQGGRGKGRGKRGNDADIERG